MIMNQLRTLGDFQYDSNNCIGEGAFGKVFRGTQLSTKINVAIKKIDSAMINREQYLKDSLDAEIKILKSLQHQNIVKFIDQFKTDRSIYIVTEFCEDGDLRNLMKQNIYISEMEVFKIFCQLIDGIEYLVKKNIIHRDLKPANILNHNSTVKIADFGFAKYIDQSSNQLLRTCVGSPLYMSPQILQRKNYSSKSDIWSLGVILYEMLFKKPPWNGFNETNLKKNISTTPLLFPSGIKLSEESKMFLIGALQKEEADRWDWEKVFSIFKNIKEKYKIQTPFSFKSAVMASQIISKENLKVKSVQDQMKLRNAIRLQLSFTYFVNVEMIQNIVLVNHSYPKQLHFEMLCLLLAKLISLKYQNYIQEILQFLKEKGQEEKCREYINIILNESELAQQLLIQTMSYFEMTGKLTELKLQTEEYQFIEKQEINQIEELEKKVENKIYALARGIQKIDEKFIQMPYEVLSLLDYILDTQITSNQIKKHEEFKYFEIHDKEKHKADLKNFAEEIRLKIERTYKW